MNPNRTNDLWCKTCKYHKCRCERTGEMRVPWPIKRMTREEFEQQYADDRPENQWPHGSLTTVPSAGRQGWFNVVEPPSTQYTRTLTMDDLRRNALESVKCKTEGFTHDSTCGGDFEELKERDA